MLDNVASVHGSAGLPARGRRHRGRGGGGVPVWWKWTTRCFRQCSIRKKPCSPAPRIIHGGKDVGVPDRSARIGNVFKKIAAECRQRGPQGLPRPTRPTRARLLRPGSSMHRGKLMALSLDCSYDGRVHFRTRPPDPHLTKHQARLPVRACIHTSSTCFSRTSSAVASAPSRNC